MKTRFILVLVLGMILSFSCEKDKAISTSISGQLRTNGTEDVIKMSVEISRPVVVLYERTDQVGYTGSGYKVLAKTTVDANGTYSFKEDLKEDELYFLGVENLDTTIYWEIDHSAWWNMAYNDDYNVIDPGEDNKRILYISAKSWVRPRFINTNTDISNLDVFQYVFGLKCDNCNSGGLPPVFYGATDSLLPWLGKTWSGKYATGYNDGTYQRYHYVEGKLTRNGITRDTNIFYYVPPFDTSIVEIRY